MPHLITTNQTLDWSNALLEGGTLVARCHFCDLLLSIFHPADNDNDEQKAVEAFTVLPCGHAFGYNCIMNHFKSRPRAASCPTCQKPAQHSTCGHFADLRKIQQRNGNTNLRLVGEGVVLTPYCQPYWISRNVIPGSGWWYHKRPAKPTTAAATDGSSTIAAAATTTANTSTTTTEGSSATGN